MLILPFHRGSKAESTWSIGLQLVPKTVCHGDFSDKHTTTPIVGAAMQNNKIRVCSANMELITDDCSRRFYNNNNIPRSSLYNAISNL